LEARASENKWFLIKVSSNNQWQVKVLENSMIIETSLNQWKINMLIKMLFRKLLIIKTKCIIMIIKVEKATIIKKITIREIILIIEIIANIITEKTPMIKGITITIKVTQINNSIQIIRAEITNNLTINILKIIKINIKETLMIMKEDKAWENNLIIEITVMTAILIKKLAEKWPQVKFQ
jgi:hypothetical protein